MTEVPVLCVVVPLPTSPRHLDDLAWSVLREHSLALEVIILVDPARDPATTLTAKWIASADERARVIFADSSDGINAAIGAALDETPATYVTVADPDGLCADGGYRELVRSLESTGSDLAVGVAESLGKNRKRVARAVEAALDSPAQRIHLDERPGLVADDLICTKVARHYLLRSVVERGDRWSGRRVSASLLASAARIDILTRTVYWVRRHEGFDTQRPTFLESVEDLVATRAALQGVSVHVRALFAQTILAREILSSEALKWLAQQPPIHDLGQLVRNLVMDLAPPYIANFPVTARWQLAAIALDEPSLIETVGSPVHSLRAEALPPLDSDKLRGPAWGSLGLGGRDVRAAVLERFGDRPVPSSRSAYGTPESPEVSVVIPTFNVADYVDELLSSIRSAVGVDLEIIVVDDGSTDGTWDRLLETQQIDPRVRPFRSPGSGGGQARNFGVELARGEYVAFADGDDLVPPHAYAHMLDIARRTRAQVVTGNYLKFFALSTWDARAGYNHAYAHLLESISIAQHPQLARHRAVWNRLVQRQHWLDVAFPFPGVPRSNDIVAMMTVMLSASSMAVTPAPVYVYRARPGSGSMTSAAGSADYTVSYFSEEAICASLVAQKALPSVTREYWSMVLRGDAWKNILKYLERRTGDAGEDSRVARQIALLVERVPRSQFLGLGAEYQAVWGLASAGDFNSAATVQLAMKSASQLSPTSIVHAITAVAGLNIVSQHSVGQLAMKYLLRRIINDPDWRTPETLSLAIPILRTALTDPLHPMSVVPMTLEERLARAIVSGSVDDALQSLKPSTPAITATIKAGATQLRVGGTGFRYGVPARVVARRYGDRARARIPLGHVRIVEGGWVTTIHASTLPSAGLWVLEMEYEDEWGMRRSPLRLTDARSRLLPPRLKRITTVRARRVRSLIRLREPFGIRVRRVTGRILSR